MSPTQARQDPEPEPEPAEQDFEYELTEHARYTVTLKTQFTYRGHSHWPGVEISDGCFPIVDQEGNSLGFEDTESMIYRIEEAAQRRLNAIIARMKREIDNRAAADVAAIRNEQ